MTRLSEVPAGRQAGALGGPAGWSGERERSRGIPASSLHEIHRLVQQRVQPTVALHVGEPHIRMPATATEAFLRAVRDGQTNYTDAPGLLSLREAIAERLVVNGAPTPDRVFVTPGSCQAIAAVMQSVAVDGGVVLLPEIHWPVHLQQVLLAGLTPRFYSTTGSTESIVESLERVHDDAVRLVVVNSPANPSGAVLPPSVVAAIHAWAVHRRSWVISDEAYEDFAYEGAAPAMAALDGELPEADRVVFSSHTFSKGFSMTGCRLGFVTTPNDERAQLLSRVQEATLVSPSTPVQHAGLGALRDLAHLQTHHAYVRATRDEVVRRLEPSGLVWTVPAGGWYALLDLSAHTEDTHRFCLDLLDEAGVALAPGYGFLPAGHPLGRRIVRMTLCAERQTTVAGIDRLLGYLHGG